MHDVPDPDEETALEREGLQRGIAWRSQRIEHLERIVTRFRYAEAWHANPKGETQ
jgi:hypothetical protein